MPEKLKFGYEKGKPQVSGAVTPEEVATMFPESFGVSAEDMRRMETEKKPAFTPPGGRPPEEFTPIDYSNRDAFEEHVFSQLGGNPYALNPYEEIAKADQRLPQLFNQVFSGKVVWADRDKLDKNQANFWNDVVKQYHAHVYDRAVAHRDRQIKLHTWMMNRFDYERKTKEAALERFRKMEVEARAGKREARAERREERLATAAEKEKAPITWATATDELRRRFPNVDIEPREKKAYDLAYKELIQLQKQKANPLESVAIATDNATSLLRKAESRLQLYLDRYPDRRDEILKKFVKQFGYEPIEE